MIRTPHSKVIYPANVKRLLMITPLTNVISMHIPIINARALIMGIKKDEGEEQTRKNKYCTRGLRFQMPFWLHPCCAIKNLVNYLLLSKSQWPVEAFLVETEKKFISAWLSSAYDKNTISSLVATLPTFTELFAQLIQNVLSCWQSRGWWLTIATVSFWRPFRMTDRLLLFSPKIKEQYTRH